MESKTLSDTLLKYSSNGDGEMLFSISMMTLNIASHSKFSAAPPILNCLSLVEGKRYCVLGQV
jgi:hypothetical protein